MELKKESGKIMQDLGVGAAPDSNTRNRQGGGSFSTEN